MVVRAIAGEVSVWVAQAGDLVRALGALGIVHDIGDTKAQQIDLEPHAFIHLHEIESKMAEQTNFKGLVKENSADIEFFGRASHDAPPNIRAAMDILSFSHANNRDPGCSQNEVMERVSR